MSKTIKKELVGDISMPTKEERQPLKLPDNFEPFTPLSEDEKKTFGWVMDRYQDMMQKRSRIDRNWKLFQRQFESIWNPDPQNGRTLLNFPIELAIIESYISEAHRRPAQFEIIDETENEGMGARLIKRVWDHDWETNERNVELDKDDYQCGIFGTSVVYTGVETTMRKILDPDFSGENIKFVPKIQKRTDIIVKSCDIRYFWADDRVNDWKDAVDCIYITHVPWETLYEFKDNPLYKNIDQVRPQEQPFEYTFVTREETFKKNMVEIMMYYNRASDRHIEIANRATIIRDTPLMNPKKELPFTIRQCFVNPNSVYGRGFCETVMCLKHEFNVLKNTLSEAIKRSNNQVVAIGGDLDFDGEEFGYTNTILKFNGNINQLTQLSGNPPNQAIFNYIESLYRDISISTGIDIQTIVGKSGQTAYQTAVQQEISTKRVNNILYQRDLSYQRLGKLHLANLQYYFPRKTVRDLFMPGEEESKLGKYPKIKLKNEQVLDGEIVPSPVDTYFEIDPDKIRGEYKVLVRTNYNQPTLRQAQKENLIQGMNAIAQVEQLAQGSEAIANKKDELIKEIAFSHGLNIMFDDRETKIQKDREKEVMDMMNSMISDPSVLPEDLKQESPQGGPQMPPPQGGMSPPNNPLESNKALGQAVQ